MESRSAYDVHEPWDKRASGRGSSLNTNILHLCLVLFGVQGIQFLFSLFNQGTVRARVAAPQSAAGPDTARTIAKKIVPKQATESIVSPREWASNHHRRWLIRLMYHCSSFVNYKAPLVVIQISIVEITDKGFIVLWSPRRGVLTGPVSNGLPSNSKCTVNVEVTLFLVFA
jgi:hypothetical protein